MQCSTAEHKPGCICNDCLDPPYHSPWKPPEIHDVKMCQCVVCKDARFHAKLREPHPRFAELEECMADTGEATDPVNHPPHYTAGGIECIDAIKAALTEEEFRGYCKGNALKYVWRERHKGGTESLAKASWYLNWINQ